MLLLSQTVQYSIMSLVCFTPYILSYIASFFNCFLFQLLIGIDNGQLTIIGATDVFVFGIRWLKRIPTSETVGNGPNITRADEWNHAM